MGRRGIERRRVHKRRRRCQDAWELDAVQSLPREARLHVALPAISAISALNSWQAQWLVIVTVMLVLSIGCSRSNGNRSQPLTPTMREVTLPDLSRMDPSVQAQVRQQHQSMLETIKKPGITDEERGKAYGTIGMVLQAGEYYEAAEPAYLNAQGLMPNEPRWPYFLAHLQKSRGDTAKSITHFNRVLEISPNDVPTLIWLGRTYLDQGQADMAEPVLERARQLAPQVPSILVGLGQAALARRDFARAAATLEEALTIDPDLQSVHSPLAMAYRGLGDTAKAEAHLKLWKNTDVLVPDPFRRELDLMLDSGLSYELRGDVCAWPVVAAQARNGPLHERRCSNRREVVRGNAANGPGGGNRRDRGQGALQPGCIDGIERAQSASQLASVIGRALQPELRRGAPGAR
jgi:Tetratricopeptide repeat